MKPIIAPAKMMTGEISRMMNSSVDCTYRVGSCNPSGNREDGRPFARTSQMFWVSSPLEHCSRKVESWVAPYRGTYLDELRGC